MGRFFSRLGVAAVLLLIIGIYVTQSGMWADLSRATGIGDPDAQLSAPKVPAPGSMKGEVANPLETATGILQNRGNNTFDLWDEAIALLDGMPTAKPNVTDFDRADMFGGWTTNKDGCTTSEVVLARDLTDVKFSKDNPCVPVSGTLTDPYTGGTIKYSASGSTQVQVVPVVNPKNAWASGADAWTQDQRANFYNDPNNLLAVGVGSARNKEGAGPEGWLPKDEDAHCAYVTVWVQTKHAWDLTMTEQEANAINTILRDCMKGNNE